MDAPELVQRARDARGNAYAPYSDYRVGAALLTDDGRVFTGVNVENASYGLTVCAERSAIFTAVAAGARSFQAIAVATEDGASCCGACRQVLFEFGGNTIVHLAPADGAWKTTTVANLLPEAFGPDA
ncbi:MAG: cytidine deaminase [Planctomycetota bacterium]|nr:cytidine deaminase [Planctomycetota bacterium]